MGRFTLLTVLFFVALCPRAAAQKENNVWIFGHHGRLNFNSGVPVLESSNISSMEGSASVSDASGSLLFYSNGNSVWDASNNVMPNGNGILGNGSAFPELPCSSSQGVAIVRLANDKKRYYLFVLDAAEEVLFDPFTPGYLRYSIVDMSLNGGLGDVLPSAKNVIVDSAIGEQMCLVQGNGCYVWLIVHSNTEAVYKAFKIDDEGIHAPVVSPGVYYNPAAGEMKISPDATKLAMIVLPDPEDVNASFGAVELSNFDHATGIVNNTLVIDQQSTFIKYGLAFSPDNSKLYCGNYQDNLVQYDISTFPNLALIEGSKATITTGKFGGMRLGPDNKIYIAPGFGDFPYIGRINNPDQAGTACNMQTTAIHLQPDNFFPPSNLYVSVNLGNAVVIVGSKTDTIFRSEAFDLCPGQSVTLSVRPEYDTYVWDDGSQQASRVITTAGTYIIYGTTECGTHVDYYEVRALDAAVHLDQPDTTICYGASITLKGRSAVNNTWLWNTGSDAASIVVSKEGTYILTGTNPCGSFSDSVHLTIKECECRTFVPTAFSPNADSKNDLFIPRITCPAATYQLYVYNRYGQRMFSSLDPGTGWDGTYHNVAADLGTYFYLLRYTSARGASFEQKGDVVLIR